MFGYSFSFIIRELIPEWLYRNVVCGLCPLHYKAAKQYVALIGIPATKFKLNSNLKHTKMAAINVAMSIQACSKFEYDKQIKQAYHIMSLNEFSDGECITIGIAVGEFSSTISKLKEAYSIILDAYVHTWNMYKKVWKE